MIDINEINQEIERLENMGCLNYSICNKLAMMYIIKDHYDKVNSTIDRPIANDIIEEPITLSR